jgi:hypothetical protein
MQHQYGTIQRPRRLRLRSYRLPVSYLPYIDDFVNRNARLERTTRHLLGRGTWSAQATPVLLNLIPDGYYRDR